MGQMQNKNRSQRPLFRSLRKLKALKLRKKKQINTMEKIPVNVDIWLIQLFFFTSMCLTKILVKQKIVIGQVRASEILSGHQIIRINIMHCRNTIFMVFSFVLFCSFWQNRNESLYK